MTTSEYFALRQKVCRVGFADEIEWARNLKECDSALEFFMQYAWVVIASGMKEQIARKIYNERVIPAIADGKPLATVYKHQGKARAIEECFRNQNEWFSGFLHSENRIEYLESLPWIGNITKYHLARNLGMDCCKPDRHLQRVAELNHTTPMELCRRLADDTGDRIGVVDIVIWRAANLGYI